jgi:hypothetical protein
VLGRSPSRMAFVFGWKAGQRITLLQYRHGLCAPGGSLMLAAEPGYGLEATIHGRQIDIEGVIGLRDNLKERGRHGWHCCTLWPLKARHRYSAGPLSDRQPLAVCGLSDGDRRDGAEIASMFAVAMPCIVNLPVWKDAKRVFRSRPHHIDTGDVVCFDGVGERPRANAVDIVTIVNETTSGFNGIIGAEIA